MFSIDFVTQFIHQRLFSHLISSVNSLETKCRRSFDTCGDDRRDIRHDIEPSVRKQCYYAECLVRYWCFVEKLNESIQMWLKMPRSITIKTTNWMKIVSQLPLSFWHWINVNSYWFAMRLKCVWFKKKRKRKFKCVYSD